jgi:aspartate carbamoyltransferase catalytic subunit
LLGIEPLTTNEIELILTTARSFQEVQRRPIKKVPPLRGKTVTLAFFEPSTRTRTSFEIAAQRLGADVISVEMGTSSVLKGESLIDTMKTLDAMRPDLVVMRHAASGAPHLVSRHIRACVVNAGDGMHEHPTQALLDARTICDRKGTLQGLKVAIVGDVLHSRVARSNLFLLSRMGARVVLCGPPPLAPKRLEQLAPNLTVCHDVNEALRDADVVMMLRVQTERLQGPLFPSASEYRRLYGLNQERLGLAKPDALIMHPGPLIRGLELTPQVADGKQSVVLDQVLNGIAVRMAVLFLTLGVSEEVARHA